MIKNLKNFRSRLILRLIRNGRLNKLSDEKFLKLKYWAKMDHKHLNLNNPQTFNEKLQWLKINDRNPLYTILADKYKMKEWVSEKIGGKYIVPLLGVWNNVDDIDFNKLPDEFVLKCNHNSGLGMVICKDKSKLNIVEVKNNLKKGLRQNYFDYSREWPYKNIEKKIVAEKLLCDDSGEQEDSLIDYKFFCFNGQPKIMYISKDNALEPKTDFFDMDFNRLDLRMKDKNSEIPPDKPKNFEKMKELASKLSKGIPHVRVDFYCVNEQIFVGEMTFFHNGGFSKIYPERWQKILGDWIDLSKAYCYKKNQNLE